MSDSIPKVRDFMTPAPQVIAADLTLSEARDRMFQLNARHLPVVQNDALVGILSQRDIALVESVGGDRDVLTVEQAMSPQPFSCGPDAHLHAVAAEMAEHKYGAAVVVEAEHPSKVVGLFTTTDALRALAKLHGHD